MPGDHVPLFVGGPDKVRDRGRPALLRIRRTLTSSCKLRYSRPFRCKPQIYSFYRFAGPVSGHESQTIVYRLLILRIISPPVRQERRVFALYPPEVYVEGEHST